MLQICGKQTLDIELLQQCTEYEDVDPKAPHIAMFWQVLKEFTPEECSAFLRFVSARSRLPASASGFNMSFKIQPGQGKEVAYDPDRYLPHSQTCFFSLSLPAYTSVEVLRKKLIYAISQTPTVRIPPSHFILTTFLII
jgi:hypothetical protein